MTDFRIPYVFAVLLFAASLGGPRALAQDVNVVLTGYGTTGYEARVADSLAHDFSASFTPTTLFKMGENVLFQGELDFGLHDGTTTTTLEHAQVYYLGWNRVQLTAGKFLLPFGIWKHQSWINRMPDPPLLYGHAHGGAAEKALLPILYGVGAKAMGKVPISSQWALGISAWVSQGPRPASGDHAEGDGHGGGHETSSEEEHHGLEIPQIGYGITYADNNANKMVGGRLRLMNRRNFMVDLAGFYARYDAAGRLGITGTNLSVKWQPGAFDLRGEGILLRQEFLHDEAVETAQRGGYYLQLTRRFGTYEPVLRWSHLPASRLEGEKVQAERRQLAVGLNYWITPSIPVKGSYQWALDGPDGVRLQWAFGF